MSVLPLCGHWDAAGAADDSWIATIPLSHHIACSTSSMTPWICDSASLHSWNPSFACTTSLHLLLLLLHEANTSCFSYSLVLPFPWRLSPFISLGVVALMISVVFFYTFSLTSTVTLQLPTRILVLPIFSHGNGMIYWEVGSLWIKWLVRLNLVVYNWCKFAYNDMCIIRYPICPQQMFT